MKITLSHTQSYFPFIWGTDIDVEQINEDEIVVCGNAFLPRADLEQREDLYAGYLSSVRTHFAQKINRRTPPHISFANAITDDLILQFLGKYGPYAPRYIRQEEFDPAGEVTIYSNPDISRRLWATEFLSSLRRERRTFSAALALMHELRAGEKNANENAIRDHISVILKGIAAWPEQWAVESKWRNAFCPFPIPWQFEPHCDRINNVALRMNSNKHETTAKRDRALLISPFQAGQLVICELINAFPPIVQYFNEHPIESLPVGAAVFGVRPCLYLVLRREYLSGGATGMCRNDRCTSFYVIQRSGQAFCHEGCSQTYRQRAYWAKVGAKRRRERRKKAIAAKKVTSRARASPR
jgi:hypothetical protein